MRVFSTSTVMRQPARSPALSSEGGPTTTTDCVARHRLVTGCTTRPPDGCWSGARGQGLRFAAPWRVLQRGNTLNVLVATVRGTPLGHRHAPTAPIARRKGPGPTESTLERRPISFRREQWTEEPSKKVPSASRGSAATCGSSEARNAHADLEALAVERDAAFACRSLSVKR
jgi:hypothetical protein